MVCVLKKEIVALKEHPDKAFGAAATGIGVDFDQTFYVEGWCYISFFHVKKCIICWKISVHTQDDAPCPA